MLDPALLKACEGFKSLPNPRGIRSKCNRRRTSSYSCTVKDATANPPNMSCWGGVNDSLEVDEATSTGSILGAWLDQGRAAGGAAYTVIALEFLVKPRVGPVVRNTRTAERLLHVTRIDAHSPPSRSTGATAAREECERSRYDLSTKRQSDRRRSPPPPR